MSWSVMHVGNPSIAENGNKKGKQTMLYFKHVTIFNTKLYQNKSSSDALPTLLFLYHNFVKMVCFQSKWICACYFVQVRICKTYWFLKIKISLKQTFIYHILWMSTFDQTCVTAPSIQLSEPHFISSSVNKYFIGKENGKMIMRASKNYTWYDMIHMYALAQIS